MYEVLSGTNYHLKTVVKFFYFRFYVIFEKMEGGSLLKAIESRSYLTEQEASVVIREVTSALNFLHKKGVKGKKFQVLCLPFVLLIFFCPLFSSWHLYVFDFLSPQE